MVLPFNELKLKFKKYLPTSITHIYRYMHTDWNIIEKIEKMS